MAHHGTEHRKLAAIMFTDMVGYTLLAQQDEAAALELLEKHRRFLRAIFPKHQGQEIKTLGDGFLVQFASALAAVRRAIEIQQRVAKRNTRTISSRRFQLRIGIHLGDVVRRKGDVFGDGVNIAARIEPLAEPGGICFSQQVFDQVQNLITRPITRLEKVELRNVSRLMDLYRISVGKHAATLPPAPKAADRKSVAVLPFVNMSAEKENEFLSDGITEDLLTALSQVKGLRVAARTSSFAFKGKNEDIRKIGAHLGVASVLEGSVRKSGRKLRVIAKLINVADGNILWSQRYDRTLEDVFAIQDEISRAIVQALRVRLVGEPDTPLVKRRTDSTDAYQLYLRGRHFWNLRGEGLLKGLHYFELARLEDPRYALAHAGLADSYILLGYYGYLPSLEAFPKAKAAALNALGIDSALAEAHCSLGFLHFLFDWDFAAAEKEFKRALTLNPGYITTHYWYSSCLVGVGREAEALAQDQQTLEKDPLSVLANAHYAWTLVGLRRYDAAIQQIQATLKLDPNFAIAYRLLGQCYTQLQRHEQAVEAFQKAIDLSQAAPSMLAWLGYAFGRGGRRAEAEKVMTKLQEQSKSIYVRAFLFALVRIGLGDQAGALHWLQKAREEHDFWLQWLATDAAFDTLRSDRRFGQLLKSAGAPQAAPLQARPRVRTHPHPPGLAARAAVVS